MRQHSAAGFSLIEVVVATAILVTVAAGTAQLFAITVQHEVSARQQLAMSSAASSKLDELSAAAARAPAPGAPAGAVDRRVAGYSDVATVLGATFERRWSIAPLTSYSSAAVIITVRVIPLAMRAARELEAVTIAEAAP